MYPIIERDSALRPFERDINLRMDNYYRMHRLLTGGGSLSDFANAHEYYGFHHTDHGWVYREWAPGAQRLGRGRRAHDLYRQRELGAVAARGDAA